MLNTREQIWRLARRFGGARLTAWAENDQYRRGKWVYLGNDRRPMVTELVEKLAAGGRVVEHGCGEGHLARSVDPRSYESYVGYDISEVAIELARSYESAPTCRFEVEEFTTWPGDRDLQLIVIEECLYYLRLAQMEPFLRRCHESLRPGGAMLVTFTDPVRYQSTVDACCREFPDNEHIDDENGARYLVMRP